MEKLKSKVEYKFFGIEKPTKKQRGKNFYQKILDTYYRFPTGFNKIIRVLCTWAPNEDEFNEVKKYIVEKYKIMDDELCSLSFRDNVMPELLNNIKTANYENYTLRIFSIFKAYLKSIKRN